MKSTILKKTDHPSTMVIWFPRYSDAYKESQERVALLAKYKVDSSQPHIIVEFSKAKHLIGQRYHIKRSEAMTYPLDNNGKIPCYAVPMSAFDYYEWASEVRDAAFKATEGMTGVSPA